MLLNTLIGNGVIIFEAYSITLSSAIGPDT